MPARAPKTAKAAVILAWRGETDVALGALTRLADAGDARAAASAVEILAFQGKWAALVPYAMEFLVKPSAVDAGNVFTDVASLVRRAARELREPAIVKRAAKVVPQTYAAMARASLTRDLATSEKPGGTRERAHYDAAVRDATSDTGLAPKSTALAEHLFALAATYRIEDEMIRRWAKLPAATGLLDDGAFAVARIHAKRGNATRAWSTIASRLGNWYAIDIAQVAPVVLLYDAVLSPLMTARRCAQVLATPRCGQRAA